MQKGTKRGKKWVKTGQKEPKMGQILGPKCAFKNRRRDTGQPYSSLAQCHFKEKGLPASHVPQHNVLPEQPFLWKRFKDIILDLGFLHLLLFLCASILLIIIVLWHCCATPLLVFTFVCCYYCCCANVHLLIIIVIVVMVHLLQLWKLILDCIDCCILFLKEQLTSSSVTGGPKMVEREADELYLYLCLCMWHKHVCFCVFVDLREKLKSRLEGFEAQPRIILGSGKMIGEHQLLPSANWL